MNILRWKRKSKKKIKFKSLVLIIFSLIMTTFAWFAYSKVLNTSLNIHMASWDMEYYIDEVKKTNPIAIEFSTLYPSMPEQEVTIDIKNNGETLVDIEYYVKSVTIAGTTYEIVQEGSTPTQENYIMMSPSVLERLTHTEEVEGESITIIEYIYKGAVTNDITKFPFTIEIEHSAQVDSVSVDDYGTVIPGEGYLKITVNWIGDNDKLDSEWGYIVGEYLSTEGATSALSINLSIESYQADGLIQQLVATQLPSTTETKPYLPTGFNRVPGTTLDSGLVIADSSGNEYVWVEVPKTTTVYPNAGLSITEFSDDEYTSIETDLKAYSADYRTRDDEYALYKAIGVSEIDYNTLKQKMLKSIYQNGGFYIGRYETGIENSARTAATSGTPTQTPVIKANAYPYNWVTCSQAQTLAASMESGGNTTSLMFGLQWDLVLKYLETKGTEATALKTDSTEWGNYSNTEFYLTNSNAKYNIYNSATSAFSNWLTAPYDKIEQTQALLNTGANSTFCNQNIYDLAGNLSEWTFNIIYSDSTPIGGNGGDFSVEGVNAANYRGEFNATKGVGQVGFRVTLYAIDIE